MSYYYRTGVYLTERQKEIINKYMPQKMSQLVRDIIDVIINTDTIINPEDYKNDEEILKLIFNYRNYLKQTNFTYQAREDIREALYEHFTKNHIPIVCARYGHKKAIRVCREMIPGFREQGYLISDRVSEEMIIDYVHMVEDFGLDDQAWEEYQSSPNFIGNHKRVKIE